MSKPVVEVYAKRGCCLCKEVKKMIGRVNGEIPFFFKEVDISTDDDLFRRYNDHVPTVYINGKKAFKFRVDETEFRKRVRKEIIRAGLVRLVNKNGTSLR
ncbi:MAG: glutaredoxin family protein [Deltaproteobacteria bacterium]|nr:glutaredoxin family protein [Deltaproteobacteria bacterium]